MRKKIGGIAVGASVAALTLLAADAVWTKPYTEWTDADVKKVLTDSPWADSISVETGQRGAISQGAPADIGGGGGGRGGGGGAGGDAPIQGNLTVPVIVSWQSALPIKQALFGRANATDAQKQILTREEPSHLFRVQGLPGSVRGNTQDLDKLKSISVIKIKGKPDLHPSNIEVSAPPAPPKGVEDSKGGPPGGGGFGGSGRGFGGGNFDVFFVFPKEAPISVDDKEMEFVTKIGAMNIRKKFKLKDMVYNGKLEF